MASPSEDPQNPSPLFNYPQIILAAIEALNDTNGSDKSAISTYIESTYSDLPSDHAALLSHNLDEMKNSGQLVMVKNNYLKPDANSPPKRGRGRPPKPKGPVSAEAVLSAPRPRGRPPKPRDPFEPAAPAKSKAPSSGGGRPRGRPAKKPKTIAASAPTSDAPRGRGRPPKVKPAVAPVGC